MLRDDPSLFFTDYLDMVQNVLHRSCAYIGVGLCRFYSSLEFSLNNLEYVSHFV